MIKPVKAIFPDQNPLSPKIIECAAEIDDKTGGVIQWIFPPGTDFEDVLFFLEFVSDPKYRLILLGEERD